RRASTTLGWPCRGALCGGDRSVPGSHERRRTMKPRRLASALVRRRARVIPLVLMAISGTALTVIGVVRGDWWVLGFAFVGVAGASAAAITWLARRPEVVGLIRRFPAGDRLVTSFQAR